MGTESFSSKIGEANMQKVLNWVLRYLGGIEIPIKRGTFVEYRTGMLNISPIGAH